MQIEEMDITGEASAIYYLKATKKMNIEAECWASKRE